MVLYQCLKLNEQATLARKIQKGAKNQIPGLQQSPNDRCGLDWQHYDLALLNASKFDVVHFGVIKHLQHHSKNITESSQNHHKG